MLVHITQEDGAVAIKSGGSVLYGNSMTTKNPQIIKKGWCRSHCPGEKVHLKPRNRRKWVEPEPLPGRKIPPKTPKSPKMGGKGIVISWGAIFFIVNRHI